MRKASLVRGLQANSAGIAALPYANPTPKRAVCATMCSFCPDCHSIERSTERLQSRFAAGPDNKRQLDARCRNADLQTIHASTARIVALASSLLFASYLLQCRQKLLRRCRWLHSAFKDRLERSILTVHIVDCVLVSADLRSAHVSACERSTRI